MYKKNSSHNCIKVNPTHDVSKQHGEPGLLDSHHLFNYIQVIYNVNVNSNVADVTDLYTH